MQLPYEAFCMNCVIWKPVDLGGNVSKIGMAAFFGCTSLKQIDLSGIDSIECCAFLAKSRSYGSDSSRRRQQKLEALAFFGMYRT